MLLTLVISWQASEGRGKEAGCLRKVAGMSLVTAGCLCSAVDTLSVDSRVA